jgi:mannose-6-phosphate isomerase-like protein (cupin superfamily)
LGSVTVRDRIKVINVMEKAKSETEWVPKALAKLGDVVLELAVGNGELPFWHTNEADEYVYCLRGTIRYKLKEGEELLPEVDVNPGDFFVIPAGIAHMPVSSSDNLVLILERENPYTTYDPE